MRDPEAEMGSGTVADQAFRSAFALEEIGDTAGAIILYRQAAELGYEPAQSNLANLLSTLGPMERAEGMRWSHRAVRQGSCGAAWNLAMDYRIRGNRRRYFHWLKRAAELGDEDAPVILRVVDAIRARGGRAPMLFLAEVDESRVDEVLRKFLNGDLSREDVSTWAGLVFRGEAALGPCKSRRVAEVVEELADASRPLRKKRARELLFKLT